MILIKHPTLPTQRSVSPEALDGWLAAGWLKLLNDEQEGRLDEIALEVDLDPHDSAAAAIATDQGQHSDEGDEA